MSTSKNTVTYILDQLRNLHTVRIQSMFGEYSIYVGNKVVALLCDNQVYVKITDEGKQYAEGKYIMGYPYPGAKQAMNITEMIESADFFQTLLEITEAHLPMPVKRKKIHAKEL